jgi:uncharacterized protein
VERILPAVTGIAGPYFDGARAGVLRLQRCRDCAIWQFYPRSLCTACGSRALAWEEASGRGRIASYTVVRRPLSAAYESPSIVALIDLAEGPRMMSQIIGAAPESVTVGAAVAVRFAPWSDTVVLPVFQLVEGDA